MNVKELYTKYTHLFGDWTLPDMSGVRDDAPTVLAPWWGQGSGWSPARRKVAYYLESEPHEVVVFHLGSDRQGHEESQFIRLHGGGEWFPDTLEGLTDCKQFIDEYLNCAPCKGCKYDNFGAVFRCSKCANVKVEVAENGIDKQLYCDKSGYKIYVGDFYTPWRCMEHCKFFMPKPQLIGLIKEWGGWETQDDYLRNCEFNPSCPCHSMGGKNATCTYEYYMNQNLEQKIDPVYINENVAVTGLLIKRRQWIEQNFDVAYGVRCIKGYSKRNPKYNQGWMFETPVSFDEAARGEFPIPADI